MAHDLKDTESNPIVRQSAGKGIVDLMHKFHDIY